MLCGMISWNAILAPEKMVSWVLSDVDKSRSVAATCGNPQPMGIPVITTILSTSHLRLKRAEYNYQALPSSRSVTTVVLSTLVVLLTSLYLSRLPIYHYHILEQ